MKLTIHCSTHHGAQEECWSGPGLWDRGARCGHLQLVGTQRLGRKTLEVQGWGPAGVLVCWEPADWQLSPGAVGLKQPGWGEGPRLGCAAGAGSAGSAAGGPSSQRTLTAPCGTTGGRPAAAAAGTPTAHATTPVDQTDTTV